ncbi:MAG: menaquinone biosynthesis protein [Planctomycetota bacterium]|nr:menaquinone biosynthesis protein [Planctomycetota bacterium]
MNQLGSTAPGPIRIGAVNYLNSKPLIEGLADDLRSVAPGADLVLDYPSRLADDLETGHLDVALVPSIECLRDPDYEVVTDACVATHGPVLSVKLYSRVAISNIATLALDEGSRTSATLARVLLAERFGLHPQLEPLPLGETVDASTADAVVLIGDRAMHPLKERFVETWDLGDVWSQWTGLPFVFALWATRRGTVLGAVEDALSAARDRGLEHLNQIAERESLELGIPSASASAYLHDNLHFHLGSAERHGMELFQRLAIAQGLAPAGVDIVFRDSNPVEQSLLHRN